MADKFSPITYGAVMGHVKSLSERVDDIPSPFTFKGSVATESDLPASGDVGDLYIVQEDHTKKAWDGTEWITYGPADVAGNMYFAYGTATYADVSHFYSEGYSLFVKKQTEDGYAIYVLVGYESGTFVFANVNQNKELAFVTVDSTEWNAVEAVELVDEAELAFVVNAAFAQFASIESEITSLETAVNTELAKKVSKQAQAAKTAEMTEPVGIDEDGKLWSKPGSGGTGAGAKYLDYDEATYEEAAGFYELGYVLICRKEDEDVEGNYILYQFVECKDEQFIFCNLTDEKTLDYAYLDDDGWTSADAPVELVDSTQLPTVPTISTDITADATSDTKTASPKAVKAYVDAVLGDIDDLIGSGEIT